MSELCHKCKIAPAATGLILCAVCITKKHLRETLELEAQVKELKEKLSEFQKGIPIEKAKTDGTEYLFYVDVDGKIHAVIASYDQGCTNPEYVWRSKKEGPLSTSRIIRVQALNLPSTDTKEGEW